MDGFKFSMQSFFLLFILGLGFFIPTDLRAKQIFRLPCTSNWWSQDFTSTVNESIGTFDDEVLFQLCDEDGNTPFHVVLKLEHLSENQMFLIAVWADLMGRNSLQFSSNKQGKNPLRLLEMRIERVFERMSNSSLEEVQAMFEEESSFRREITDENVPLFYNTDRCYGKFRRRCNEWLFV